MSLHRPGISLSLSLRRISWTSNVNRNAYFCLLSFWAVFGRETCKMRVTRVFLAGYMSEDVLLPMRVLQSWFTVQNAEVHQKDKQRFMKHLDFNLFLEMPRYYRFLAEIFAPPLTSQILNSSPTLSSSLPWT